MQQPSLDFAEFTAGFPTDGPQPYDQTGVRSIETFRKGFDGVLFIDRVLKALGIGIGQGKVYPPKGDTGLRSLHKQICESTVSLQHKLSVLYYLLLDHDDAFGTQSPLAQALSDEWGLPQKYQILMRGLWHMDRKEFKFALEHLSHPSLPSEFADEIIIALVRNATAQDYSLPLAYYHATQPVLKSSEAIELFFGALSQTSILEALAFSRSYPEHTQQQLFEQLVASAIVDPKAASTKGKELASSALNGTEEKWFHEFLTSGEGKKSKNAKLVLQIRQIVTGRDRNPSLVSGILPQAAKAGKGGW